MADPKDKSEDEGVIVEKEEMVEFLSSSGKVRRGLAEPLYDQGLNTWELLVDGDEEYFTSFKGVGKKTADELMIIGGQKKEELSRPPEPARDLRDVLSEVPRVNQGVIDGLMDAGFNDVYRVSAVDPSELREVPGVGPKLSEKIVKACKEEAEKHPQSVAGVEEAMPLPADEEAPAEKGEGFLSKLIGKVKAFFSTEKEEPSTSEAPEEEGEKEPEEKPSEDEPAAEDKEETVEEKPSEEEPVAEDQEEPSEEEKPSDEEPSEEGEASDEEPAAEDKKEDGTPEEESTEEEGDPSDEETEEPPKEEPRSLWAKIKGIFSGKEEEAPSEEKESSEEGEKPSEEEAPESAEEEGETPTDDKDEEAPENEGEKEPEEAPSEDGPAAEDQEDKEEPSDEKPSEEEKEPSKEEPSEEEPRLEIKDIHHIPGVDKKTTDLLLSSGYMNLDELKEAVPEDLMMIEGIDEDTAKFIYEVLRK